MKSKTIVDTVTAPGEHIFLCICFIVHAYNLHEPIIHTKHVTNIKIQYSSSDSIGT